MVVRIQLTIRHIRGHTFPIDADVDSDVLGLKVLIWESQSIAIENQRLVFSGKELQENVKLTELGISDNSMIFLVESNGEIPQQAQEGLSPSQVIIEPTNEIETSNCNYNKKCSNKNQFRQPCEVDYYEPFEEESILAEERMQSVIDLAFWIRIYCLLGMLISAIRSIECLYCIIPFVLYTLGYIGTRKLNRCLLAFPLLLSIGLGFGLTGASIYWLTNDYHGCEFILLFVGLLHVIIFMCICQLLGRIGKLNCQEWWQTRLRIQSRCCC